MTEREKVVDKLSKIKRHMDSAKEIGNEAEAQAFAAMLNNLLLKHKLELTDVEYATEMKDEPIVEETAETIYENGKRVYKDAPDVEVRNRRVYWIEHLGHVIADAHSCSILVQPGRSVIWFVGHKSNVAICEYLFVTMQRLAERIAFYEHGRRYRELFDVRDELGRRMTYKLIGWKESFLLGFIGRIQERLQEERRKFKNDTTGMAIVRINKEALAVKQYIEAKKAKKAGAVHRSQDFHREGYDHGRKRADEMNLKANAVKAGQPNKQLED